jgi:predicted metal-binding protein
MNDIDLKIYCEKAVAKGATHAKLIQPGSVVTAPWVRLKCQFGCPLYDTSYCCPPNTPTPEQTKAVIDSYNRAIMFHIEAPGAPDRGKRLKNFYEMLTDMEGELFKDGYYKAFVFLAGPCRLCKECAKIQESSCNFLDKARPSMEGCGIDVYQTARNNGFFIEPLRERTQCQNNYCLMLVD